MQSLLFSLAFAVICTTAGLLILALRFFYPRHRLVALVFLSIGAGLFIDKFILMRHWLAQQDRGWVNVLSEYSLYAFTFIGTLFFMYIFFKFILREPSPLKGLTHFEISDLITQDQENLIYLNKTLERLATKTQTWRNLHPSEMSSYKRARLKAQWQEFVEATFELDLIKIRYRAFYQINILKNPTLHTNCFVMAYAALVSQHRNIFCVVQNVGNNENLSTFLNAEDEALALPANVYRHLKFRLTQTKTLVRLNAGRGYLSLLRPNKNQPKALLDLIYKHLKYLDGFITAMPKMMLLNPVEIVEQRAFQTWYPLQKHAAEKISYLRASRRDYLITPRILEPYLKKFKPGDIMLQRREWHATNLGIPGYWTHLAFYTGSLEEINDTFQELAYFEDETPAEYLKRKYPAAYQQMHQTIGKFSPTVIEAKRPGVIVSNVEESALCDSLAVLRTKVSLLDKFKAIEKAFSFVGLPYDYSFDFRNQKAMLCSEIIYKGYQEAYGLKLETELVNGRPLFPPNKLAQKFDEEFDENSELEFVMYLEGNEKKHKVSSQNAAYFRHTWRRPKWYILRRYASLSIKK